MLSVMGCGGPTSATAVYIPAASPSQGYVEEGRALTTVGYFKRGSDIHEPMLGPQDSTEFDSAELDSVEQAPPRMRRERNDPHSSRSVSNTLKLQVDAVCVDESESDRQPTCNFDAADAGRGVKLRQAGAQGAVRWCAGDEPLPWISSARAAKVDITYQALGLSSRPASAKPGADEAPVVLGAPIGHNFLLASILGQNALVATDGSVAPLQTVGDQPLTPSLLSGGVYPPTKGTSLLRMPDADEPIFRIDFDGSIQAIPRPDSAARYLGWATSGGGQDSLWRWPVSRGEVWAIAHHRADGTIVGKPEQFSAPGLCASLPEIDDNTLSEAPRFRLDRLDAPGARHGGHPSRGIRVAQVIVKGRAVLCIDHARAREDHQFWRADRAPTNPSHQGERGATGSIKVTCGRWELEHPSSMHAAAGH